MREIECATEGRVVSDVETRTSKAGKPYARFRLVVGDGDTAQWLSVTAIGPKAMEVVPSLAKADSLYLEGSIKLEKWTGQDGVERSGLSVLAWKLVPLGKIGRSKPAQARPSTDASQAQPNAYAAAKGKADWQRPNDTDTRPAGGMLIEDGIPF
jgi:single-stranded DNA-binding protein